jgi:hypothetical protein
VDKQVGSLGRKRGIELTAKTFLIRLFGCRSEKIEVKASAPSNWLNAGPVHCDSDIMRLFD